MAIHTPKSSSSKAQFFILSAVTIVTILFFLSRYIEPAGIVDISAVILNEETFVFSNIKEKSIQVVKEAKDCEELKFNLEEYKIFAEKFSGRRGFSLELNYTITCNPIFVEFYMKLRSEKIEIEANYSAKP